MPVQPPLKPGKGLSADMTADSLRFVAEAVNTIRHAYIEAGGDDNLDEVGPVVIYREMRRWLTEHGQLGSSLSPWREEVDKYGHKLFVEIPWAAGWNGYGATAEPGAIRVTLVLTKTAGLKLDIRAWYR